MLQTAQSSSVIGVQGGGPPPPPLKNLQHPRTLKKFDTTSLFQKHHKGFSWQKPQKIFLASGRIYLFPSIIIRFLRRAKSGHFYVKAFQHGQKKPIKLFDPYDW